MLSKLIDIMRFGLTFVRAEWEIVSEEGVDGFDRRFVVRHTPSREEFVILITRKP